MMENKSFGVKMRFSFTDDSGKSEWSKAIELAKKIGADWFEVDEVEELDERSIKEILSGKKG